MCVRVCTQSAYNDMKALLKKSMDECVRLSEEVVKLEGQVGEIRSVPMHVSS